MISHRCLNEILKVLPTPSLVLLPNYPEFTIIEVNNAYLELTHLLREEVVGQGFLKIFLKNSYVGSFEWRMSLEKVLHQKIRDKIPAQKFSIPVPGTSEAETKYLSIENIPILNDNNEVELILRSLTDITPVITTKKHEKEIYKNLIKHEKFLVETQRLARSGSWEMDLIDNTLTWSDVVKEIHEVNADYVPELNNAIQFYKDGENRERLTKAVYEAIKTGNPFDLELTLVTAKSNERMVRTSGTAEIKDGRCIRLYGVLQDITDKKNIQQELIASRNQFKSLLQTVEGIVWEADAQTLKFTFVSDHVKKILGFSPHQWIQEPAFWQNQIHPDDRLAVIDYLRSTAQNLKNSPFNYRMINADNNIVWMQDTVSIIYENGEPKWLRGLMVDITTTKRLSEVEHLEKKVLELNSIHDISIQEALTAYLSGIEALFPQLRCSILQVKNNCLYTWSAPSLPQVFTDAIEGISIGENAGSCGTAAFLKKKVIVSNIETDPRWTSYKDIALKYNLNSCWSYPIINTEGDVMASFGIYSTEPMNPKDDESKIFERAAAVLKVILENRQNSEALKETTALMTQGQELAHFGNWSWDIQTNTVHWSDSLYAIYGLNKSKFKATFEGYLELLHPQDKERVSANILNVLKTKKDTEFEERIIHPSGEIRHIKSWGKVKTDKEGTPVKMIGACLDITESKKVQEELLASESRLRSLVDSQTNYVIRIDFDGKLTYTNKKYIEDFGWLYNKTDLTGMECIDSVLPYHHKRVLETAKSCLQSPNKIFQVELDKQQKDGHAKSTLWHFIGLTDSKGTPSEIQCIGIDVTNQKQAENALKESNERYDYVNKATNDAIYDWDIPKDNITWGEGFYRIFGYEINKSFSINDWSDALYPSDSERIKQSIKTCLEDITKSKWIEDYQFRRADGSYAFIEENGYVIRDDDGKAIRMIGVLRDITERKLAEEELKGLHQELEIHLNVLALSNAELDASQKRYRDLFHLSPQPMWVYEVETLNFLDVNDAAINHYGYSREEFLNMKIIEIRPPEDIPETLTAVKQTKNELIQRIFRHQKKNGEIIYVEIQRNIIQFKNKITHLILANDITERIKYIDAIEKQNLKLKEIAFMQSHMVRAPLSKIMGLIDLIKNTQITDNEKTELLDYILTSAYELDSIIKDISGKTERVELI